jgi:DNA-binding SARP family transcriptional activator
MRRVAVRAYVHWQNQVPTMAQLEIRVLGAPEIFVAGAPLYLQQQKARALLFYLGATGRAHARDHLATLLWSESDAPSAHHSLRSTLYLIRRTLQTHSASEAFVVDRASVRIELQALSCDLLRFRDHLAEKTESALAEAVSLCRGPLLEGFTIRDAPEFDRWQRDAALDLLNSCRAALGRLIDLATRRRAHSDEVRYLQLLTQLDPLDEAAQRRLMNVYLEEGLLQDAPAKRIRGGARQVLASAQWLLLSLC